MARKPTALAELDIASEGLAQQDGLAERLARRRGQETVPAAPAVTPRAAMPAPAPRATAAKSHNQWREGKSVIQVWIPEDIAIEISILAKRRRMAVSQLAKEAINAWLEAHGHALRLPD